MSTEQDTRTVYRDPIAVGPGAIKRTAVAVAINQSEFDAEVVANCDHLERLKFSRALPYVFTEHGGLMAASVLNSRRAVEMSVFVVRAFVNLADRHPCGRQSSFQSICRSSRRNRSGDVFG